MSHPCQPPLHSLPPQRRLARGTGAQSRRGCPRRPSAQPGRATACPAPAHLGHGLLAAAAAHAHAIDNVALLGLEAHAARLVRAAGPRQAHNAGQLAVLPAPHAEEEAEHIALLLLPELLDVLVCTWGGGTEGRAQGENSGRLPPLPPPGRAGSRAAPAGGAPLPAVPAAAPAPPGCSSRQDAAARRPCPRGDGGPRAAATGRGRAAPTPGPRAGPPGAHGRHARRCTPPQTPPRPGAPMVACPTTGCRSKRPKQAELAPCNAPCCAVLRCTPAVGPIGRELGRTGRSTRLRATYCDSAGA